MPRIATFSSGTFFGLWALAFAARAQSPTLSRVWVPDLGNGTHKNPGRLPLPLRVAVRPGARCQFSYSLDKQFFIPLGVEFLAREGKWVSVKMGVFCLRPTPTPTTGFADVDWWRMEP